MSQERVQDSTDPSKPHDTLSHQEVRNKIDSTRLVRLVFCASGICGCYITYGILHERLYQSQALGASFVLFTQCVTNVLVSSIWRLILLAKERPSPGQRSTMPHGWFIATALCYSIAMVCSNEAVRYVSYPIQVLAKSCKLIPTMLVGQFIDQRTIYGKTEWYAALLICTGIVLFHSTRSSGGGSKASGTSTTSLEGSLLLLSSLTMDGFLSSFQNRIKQCASPPNAAVTMFSINFYALFFLYGICCLSGQWDSALVLIFQDQKLNMLSALGVLNATVGVGQIFIFLTIDWFTPVTTTIITTSRKFLTIVISAILYSHHFGTAQWVAIITVFSGLYMAILTTVRKTQVKGDEMRKKVD